MTKITYYKTNSDSVFGMQTFNYELPLLKAIRNAKQFLATFTECLYCDIQIGIFKMSYFTL